MSLDPIGGPTGGQAGKHLRPIERRPLHPRPTNDRDVQEGVMAGYEIVGIALLALFFGSLVSSKQSISR
jgi:hypothetical protein